LERGAPRGRFCNAGSSGTTALLTSGKIDLTKIITHRFALKDFEEAMKVMKSGECGKILLSTD
jgi:threonine dehydrogenase-like Zn-dependent dehydrogenase